MTRAARVVNGINLAAHGGLIGRIVHRYRGSIGGCLEWDDLFQVGWLGLHRAAQMFDPTKGFRFSTYANHWIRHFIQRAIMDQRRTVRVPIHAQESARQRGERLPYDALSLDAPLSSDEPGETWLDRLRSDSDPSADAERGDLAEHVDAALGCLRPAERRAVKGRFWGEHTLVELGDDTGVTRECIRQREAKALARLEGPLGKLRESA